MRKVIGKLLQQNPQLHARRTTMTDEADRDTMQSFAWSYVLWPSAHGLPQSSTRAATRHSSRNGRSATPTALLFHTTLHLPRATTITKRRTPLHPAEFGM